MDSRELVARDAAQVLDRNTARNNTRSKRSVGQSISCVCTAVLLKDALLWFLFLGPVVDNTNRFCAALVSCVHQCSSFLPRPCEYHFQWQRSVLLLLTLRCHAGSPVTDRCISQGTYLSTWNSPSSALAKTCRHD